MSGPSWLAWSFAAVMILTAAYSASRLAFSRLRGRASEFDADALHVVMGAAMAGMLVPRLNVLPDGAWVAVFGIGAAWFGWHGVRAWGASSSGRSPGRFPVPHLIECVAMLYMLLPVHDSPPAHGGAGMPMARMSVSAGPAGRFPALLPMARVAPSAPRTAPVPGTGINLAGRRSLPRSPRAASSR
jgi:hypothetical protein